MLTGHDMKEPVAWHWSKVIDHGSVYTGKVSVYGNYESKVVIRFCLQGAIMRRRKKLGKMVKLISNPK